MHTYKSLHRELQELSKRISVLDQKIAIEQRSDLECELQILYKEYARLYEEVSLLEQRVQSVDRKPIRGRHTTNYSNSLLSEKFIGKYGISILAAILVVTAVVIGLQTIWVKVSKVVLFAIALLVGIVAEFFGYHQNNKDSNKNKFWLAVTGTGVAIIFVSLIIGNLLLHLYSNLAMEILVLLWFASGVFLIKRIESLLYAGIVYTGGLISIIFMFSQLRRDHTTATQSVVLFGLLVLFLFRLQAARYNSRLIYFNCIFDGLSLYGASATIAWLNRFEQNSLFGITFTGFFLSLVVFGELLLISDKFKFKSSVTRFLYALALIISESFIVNSSSTLSLFSRFNKIIYTGGTLHELLSCICAIACIVIIASLLQSLSVNFYIASSVVISYVVLMMFKDYWDVGFYLILAIDIFLILLYLNFPTTIIKICVIESSVVLLYVFNCELAEGLPKAIVISIALLFIVNLILQYFLLYTFEYKDLDILFKLLCIIEVGIVLVPVTDLIKTLTSYSLSVSICSMALIGFRIFDFDSIEDKRYLTFCKVIYNLFIISLFFYAFVEGIFFRHRADNIGFVICLLALSSLKIYDSLMNRSIFDCIVAVIITNLSIICIVHMTTLSIGNFIVSIVGVIVSAIFIALGFFFTSKHLRVFGLVCVLIYVLKVMLIDLNISSQNGFNVILLLVGGIICFAISFIYNKFDSMFEDRCNANKSEGI